MDVQDLEFLISQYADGTLDAAERAGVEKRLAEDASARALLAEYRRLDAMLKTASPTLPNVLWKALAEHISSAIDAEDECAAQRYRIGAWGQFSPIRLAIAASVLVGMGVGVLTYIRAERLHNISGPLIVADHRPTTNDDVAMIRVDGPHADSVSGPIVVQVVIGPGEAVKEQPIFVRSDDTARPSQLAIASGVIPAHDDVPPSFDMQ